MTIMGHCHKAKDPLRIFLADDQLAVRSAIRLLLEQETAFRVVGEAETAMALLEQLADSRPDLVLLDWELPGLPAVGSIAALHAGYPAMILIALSSKLEARQAALQAGADGFVGKSEPPERLLAIMKHYQSHTNRDLKAM
jgi:DNA-binding NarL/FixJ family response regulator